MTKSDLVEKISVIYPFMPVRNIEKVISIILDKITDFLVEGDRVELRGFGSFSVRGRGEMEGRNPKTGKKVMVREKKVPFFRSGRQLKNMINEIGESN
ncbi:MAG: integration host factor subunit beta [Holosporaceae bacterium]|jgi:integration host factor subunit beta|nr:integration host factor subunit beta [Holosporaceae bacterium]